MTKHSYSLMRPADFFQNFFSGIFRFFSAEKFFQKFFGRIFFPEFSAEKFFTRFFPRIFSGKIFHQIFFPRIFSGKIFSKIFRQNFFTRFFPEFFQRNIFSTSLSGIQELNLSGYPFHLTKAFFFFWSRRITFSIRKIF